MASKTLRPVLVVPDTHRPYHDRRAWKLMMAAAKLLQPEVIVIIGDFADFYTVSSHSKDPNRVKQLDVELKDVNEGLDELDKLGAEEKVFVEGNHCDRLRRYLKDKAPELFGVVGVPTLFRLKERGWRYVPYKRHTKLGKVHLTHDVGAAGRNATFQALDSYQHSIITGHAHRCQYIVEGNAVGEFKLSAQFGWLGDVEQVDYMNIAKARKNWALAFGIGYHDPSTNYVYFVPVPIINYTCMINGTVLKG